MSDPVAERVEADYREGIERFNRGEFYEAHDFWESAWRNCPPADRSFYKGLIHATVCIYQWNRGNRRGASRLYESAQRYLGGFPDICHRLRVRSFRESLATALADLADADPTAASQRPIELCGAIRLEVDF